MLIHITQFSYWGVFLALAVGILGLPVPDEILMAYCGFLTFQGTMAYVPTLLIAFLGTATGVTFEYLVGRTVGRRLLSRYSAAGTDFRAAHLQDAEAFYRRYGRFALLIGYFVPGIRHLTALLAGMSRIPYALFSLFAYLGGFLWTATFITMGYMLADKWRRVYSYSHRYILPVVMLAAVFVMLRTMWANQRRKL